MKVADESQLPAATDPSPRPSRIRLLRSTDAIAPSLPITANVLLAVDQFSQTLGGGERIALKLAGLLPQYSYRVSILTLAADATSPIFHEPVPCPIYLLPLRSTFGGEAISAAIELRRFLLDQRIAVVQTFFESSDLWVGPVAKLLAGKKLIWSRRDMGILRQRKHAIAYRIMGRLPDKVFAVSEQVRNYTIEVDRVPSVRVETLYNGLDLAAWPARTGASAGPQSPAIVAVGNIRRVKGHDVFVRAAAIVARRFPAARFSIAGEVLEPDFYAELNALARQLGIAERLTFAGGVTDLPVFLRDADLFVLPSRSEGFSNAIIEAMAAALPVVATDVGGNAEAIVDGITGRIVPPENSDALAAAILDLLENPDAARAMGQAGRRRVEERFTTEAMMRQLTDAYQSLLAHAR